MDTSTISPSTQSISNQNSEETQWRLRPELDISNIIIEDRKPVNNWISQNNKGC